MMSHAHKPIRGNFHSYDVVRTIEEFASNPCFGNIYNLSSDRANSISIVEVIDHIDA
jgi:hypothetical protein